MKFRELFENKADWKKSITSNKDHKKIVKELEAYAKGNKYNIEKEYISDLGTALTTHIENDDLSVSVHSWYNDGDEGVYPKDYSSDNKYPLEFQVEIDFADGEFEVREYDNAKDVIKFIQDMI